MTWNEGSGSTVPSWGDSGSTSLTWNANTVSNTAVGKNASRFIPLYDEQDSTGGVDFVIKLKDTAEWYVTVDTPAALPYKEGEP